MILEVSEVVLVLEGGVRMEEAPFSGCEVCRIEVDLFVEVEKEVSGARVRKSVRDRKEFSSVLEVVECGCGVVGPELGS